jgi:hypothetical protein
MSGDNDRMGIFDKAKDALVEHKDKVEQGITKAADLVDEKTGNKYAGQIDKAEELAKDRLGSYSGDPAAPAADPTPGTPDTPRGV